AISELGAFLNVSRLSLTCRGLDRRSATAPPTCVRARGSRSAGPQGSWPWPRGPCTIVSCQKKNRTQRTLRAVCTVQELQCQKQTLLRHETGGDESPRRPGQLRQTSPTRSSLVPEHTRTCRSIPGRARQR